MRSKVIQKSKYKGVSLVRDRRMNTYWICRGEVNGRAFFSKHDTELQAAKQYDIVQINNNLKPVNILCKRADTKESIKQ